jgi:hypothetical protein
VTSFCCGMVERTCFNALHNQKDYERRSKNRPQNAARAVFCGGVKVVHRRIFVS